MDSAAQKAGALLDQLRRTAMRRGAISEQQKVLKAEIAGAIEAQGNPAALAHRIAFQLVFKCDVAELGDHAVWDAIGRLLRREMSRLKTRLGLADRQIVEVLPKLSASQVEDFLEELRTTDRRIARTILNAALEAAEPLSAGRRYLVEYCDVAKQLRAIDPSVARTLANATFTARAPRRKALEHFKQFADLTMRFQDDLRFARMLAKATFRTPNPLKAAEDFAVDYNAVTAALTSNGVEGHLARTLAGLSQFRGSLRK